MLNFMKSEAEPKLDADRHRAATLGLAIFLTAGRGSGDVRNKRRLGSPRLEPVGERGSASRRLARVLGAKQGGPCHHRT